jgi:hypothetical protein
MFSFAENWLIAEHISEIIKRESGASEEKKPELFPQL